MNRNVGSFATVAAIGGVLIGGAIVVVICVIVGRLVLGPLNERAGRLRASTQFQLSDFFWLMAQLQVALVVSVRAVGIEQTNFFLIVGGFLVLATMAMWAGAVHFMSRAGVTHPPRRAVFILFLLPLTLALMIGTSLGFLAGAASVMMSLFDGGRGMTGEGLAIGLVAVVAVVGCVWGMRQISIWILTRSASARENPALGAATEISAAKSTTAPLNGA